MAKASDIQALAATAQSLSIVSQLLAITIEVGIIAGGYFVYKKIKDETTEKKEPEVVLIPDGMQLVPVEQKPTFREKFEKAKKIFHAIVS